MNLLVITLCILMQVMLIIAKEVNTVPSIYRNDQKMFSTYRTPTARPPTPPQHFIVVKQVLNGPNSDGSYSYNYETDNDIKAQEDGHLNNVGTDQKALEVQGSYSYTDNEGNTFQTSYIANENGFQPEGVHLPTIPPLIKKALQYIAEHSEKNEKE